MKKIIAIGIVAMMAVLVFGFAGLAFAQDGTPAQPAPLNPDAPGIGQMRGGRWGGQAMAGANGPLHEAVIAALAEAFGMAPETLQARLDGGETLWQVAESLGWNSDQLQAAMLSARSAALEEAVTNGLMTQEQADFMAQRMNQGWPEGYGPGSANCDGTGQQMGRQGGRGQGMRWNRQTAP